MFIKLILVLTLVCLNFNARAIDIPIVVIAPNKSPQSYSTVGSSVSILGEDTITESNNFFLGETLNNNLPGMNYFRSGGHGTITGIQLRGLPKRYSTVYIDGVKMSDPSSSDNSFYFSNIMNSSIKKVEDILEFESNKSWKEDATKSGITRPGQTIKNENEMLKKYEAIDIEFPKGAISLMHGNLIHGSHANLSKNKTRNQYSMCFMNRGVDFFVGKSSPRIRAKLY